MINYDVNRDGPGQFLEIYESTNCLPLISPRQTERKVVVKGYVAVHPKKEKCCSQAVTLALT